MHAVWGQGATLDYQSRSLRRDSPDKTAFRTNEGNSINHIASGDLFYRGDSEKNQRPNRRWFERLTLSGQTVNFIASGR